MNVNNGYWINDGYSTITTSNNVANKFAVLASKPANAHCTLELWYARANGRVIRFTDYNSPSSTLRGPLTSLRVGDGVGAGGETVRTQALFGAGQGYTNYTDFMNRILRRHGLATRFYPMGVQYNVPSSAGAVRDVNLYGNAIGCDLSTVEDFALTFVEKPVNITQSGKTAYTTETIFHVESVAPLSLIGYRKNYTNPFFFNVLKTPYGSTQFLLDQIGWIYDTSITTRPPRT